MKKVFKTMAFTLLGLVLSVNFSWAADNHQGDFKKITDAKDFTTGYYVVTGAGVSKALGNTANTNKRIEGVTVTISENKITNPSTQIVFYITVNNNTCTFKNEANNKYMYQASTTSGKGMGFQDDAANITSNGWVSGTNYAGWSFTLNGTSNSTFKWNNSSSWFANYGTGFDSGMKPVDLYKLDEGDEPDPGCKNTIAITKVDPEHGTFNLTGAGNAVCIEEGPATVTISNIVPAEHYHLGTITPSATDKGDGTYEISGLNTDTEVSVTFEPDTKTTITWSVAGETSSITPSQFFPGEAIVFPTAEDIKITCGTKTFVGWSEKSGDLTAADIVTSAAAPASATTYYAVFATPNGKSEASVTKMVAGDNFTAGDKIVILGHETKFALYQEDNGSRYVKYYSISGNAPTVDEVSANDKNWLTVSAATTSGKWILGDAVNGYLYNASSTNLQIVTNNSSEWELDDQNDGSFKLNAVQCLACRTDGSGDNKNLFRGGGSSCNSGVTTLDIYKYTPETPMFKDYSTECSSVVTKVLDHIELSGDYKTVFYTDETFNADGLIVTAYYETGDPQAVTNYSITPNPVDLTTTGEKTITVTYEEGEVMATKTYTITVKEALPKIVITATTSGITTSYADEEQEFTQNDILFSYNQWLTNANKDYIQAKKGISFSLYNSDPIPGIIKSITFVTFTGKTAYAPTVYASEDFEEYLDDMTGITAPTTTTSMTYDFGAETNYRYFTISTPGNACYWEKIVIAYEPVNATITYSAPENGTLTIKNGDATVASGSSVTSGTKLTIVTEPATDYILDDLYVRENVSEEYITIDENNQFVVPANDFTVTATFKIGIVEPTIAITSTAPYEGTVTAKITIPEGAAAVLYTLDGSDPTTNDNAEMIISNEENEVEIPGPGKITIKAASTNANMDKFSIVVDETVVITNTKGTAYTVAEAKELIDANDPEILAQPAYVKGIVSEIVEPWNAQYKNISYNISDDGETTGQQFQLFRCVTNGAAVGDEVIGYGTMTKYGNTYEFGAGNEIVEHWKKTTLSIDNIVVKKDETITPVITTNVSDPYQIIYESSDENIVYAENDEMITAGELGTATITATLYPQMGSKFKEISTTFTVQVTSDVTWNITFNANAGEDEVTVPEPATVDNGTTYTIPTDELIRAGYQFVGWNTDNTATTGLTELVNVTAAQTLYAIWQANPTCTIKFMVKGTEKEALRMQVLQGRESETFPTSADEVTGFDFIGWAEDAQTDETETVISTISKFTPTTETEKVVYALYTRTVVGEDVTDVITADGLAATGSAYTAFENKTFTSTAKYAGSSSKNNGIQLKSNDSNTGIIATTSAGTLKNISIVWNSNCTANRVLDIYAKNEAYTVIGDIYSTTAATKGTKVTSFTKADGKATSYDFTDNYAFIGIRSNSGSLNVDKISITWANSQTFYTTNPGVLYEVTYNLGEGAWKEGEGCEGASVVEGATFDICEDTPVPTDNTKMFKEWQVKGSAVSGTITINEATEIVAVYQTKPTVTITYVAGEGGQGTAPAADTKYVGDQYEVLANTWFTQEGFKFAGWKDADGTTYTVGQSIELSEDIEFIAQWKDASDKGDAVAIVAQIGDQWYAATTKIGDSKAYGVEVTIENDKVIYTGDEDIVWYKNAVTGGFTFQNADGKYLKASSGSAGVSLNDNECVWTEDETNGFMLSEASRAFFSQDGDFKNYATSNLSKSGYSGRSYAMPIGIPEPDFTLEDKAAGAYATICLPRKIDHVENATLFHISHGNINKVEFEEVTDFSEEPAGMPYLVQVTETGSVQFFCDENVTTTEPVSREDANGFVGSLQEAKQEVPNNGKSLLVSGGQLHLALDGCYLTQYHAYIDVYNVPASPNKAPNMAARRVTLYNAEAQTPTNFNGLNGNMKAQKVMKDGQFYIIREAKMYNAQGIEVQ